MTAPMPDLDKAAGVIETYRAMIQAQETQG